MKVVNDLRFVNTDLLVDGIVRAVPNMIRLEWEYTETEKAENRAFCDRYGFNSEEWKKRCEEAREQRAEAILKVLGFLEHFFTIGQLHGDNGGAYDFWFWCNDLSNTSFAYTKKSGRDYSYVTLSSFTGKEERDVENFDYAWKLLEALPIDHVTATFQYGQKVNEEHAEKVAAEIFERIKGQTVGFEGKIGKIEQRDGGKAYIFRKRYSKKYGYIITPVQLCKELMNYQP